MQLFKFLLSTVMSGRRNFKLSKRTNFPVAEVRKTNSRGKFKKTKDLTIPVNRTATQGAPTSYGFGERPFSEWDRGDLQMVFGPDVNIDDIIQKTSRSDKKFRKRKRKRRQKVSYGEKVKRVRESWKHAREVILKIFIESQVLPLQATCDLCESAATHRCTECSLNASFCHKHVQQVHQELLHAPEIWQVSSGLFPPCGVSLTMCTHAHSKF